MFLFQSKKAIKNQRAFRSSLLQCRSLQTGKTNTYNGSKRFEQFNVAVEGRVWRYLRLLKNSQLYVAEMYPRRLGTKSCAAKYTDDLGRENFGSIHYLIKMCVRCQCLPQFCECQSRHFTIISQIVIDDYFAARGRQTNEIRVNHLRKCRLTEVVLAVDVSRLQSVCFSISIDEQLYLAYPVNCKEVE